MSQPKRRSYLSHMRTSPILFLAAIALFSCSSPEEPATTLEPTPEPAPPAVVEGRFCFLHALNKDSTFVQLTLAGDSITGTMRWRPWEKDGATGTLAGIRNAAGEFELLYDYMIEGQRQTETKVMKMEGSLLWIKTGELLDPNNDGNLRYADVSKASYTQQLSAVPCP